jgi:hypothetical protein
MDVSVGSTTVASGFTSYDGAFDFASKIVGTKCKESWRGRVRIKYRKTTGTFEVQVPVQAGQHHQDSK